MTILEDYKPYIDKYGLVQDKPGNTSGNGIRYTAEAMYALLTHEDWNEEIAATISRLCFAIRDCKNSLLFENLGTGRFYLKRHPDGEPTTVDDYTAAIFFDFLIGDDVISKCFLDAGPKQNYMYAPDEGDFRFFMGRFLQLYCIANWVAGRKPSLAQEFAWFSSVLMGAFQDGQDEKVLSWMLVEIGKGRRWIFKPLIWFWRKQLRKHYGPNGIGQVLSDYYGNPDHPNAKYLRGVGV